MNSKKFSEALGELDGRYIEEAVHYKKKSRKALLIKWAAAAACIAAALTIGLLFIPAQKGMAVSVYACGADEEISAAGAVMSTGSISDSGKMKGQPLMFYLSGQDIASVRFSCKNQQINFMDWTEKRDEYGNAQNFTVAYGADESEYYYLTISWVPDGIIRTLTDNADSSIANLPEEMRSDTIVMEITFENGKTATKAITISLLDDGTFHAAFDDYRVLETDSFVKRPDSEPIPRDILYAQGEEIQTVGSVDAPPMIFVNEALYKQSQISYTEKKEDFIYLGQIQSDCTSSQDGTDGVPKENFQANHPIVGAELYQYGNDIVANTEEGYQLYELIDHSATQDPQIEQTKWGITLYVENASPAGLTLVCAQSGGIPTGRLQTGSFYRLTIWSEGSWQDYPFLEKNSDVAWEAKTYSIPLEDSVTWEIQWTDLYGELPAGTYRIYKTITDFREAGDYDTEECWAEFEIK